MNDDTLDPVANGIARYQACLAADGTLGGCSGPSRGPTPATAATGRSRATRATCSAGSTRVHETPPIRSPGKETRRTS